MAMPATRRQRQMKMSMCHFDVIPALKVCTKVPLDFPGTTRRKRHSTRTTLGAHMRWLAGRTWATRNRGHRHNLNNHLGRKISHNHHAPPLPRTAASWGGTPAHAFRDPAWVVWPRDKSQHMVQTPVAFIPLRVVLTVRLLFIRILLLDKFGRKHPSASRTVVLALDCRASRLRHESRNSQGAAH